MSHTLLLMGIQLHVTKLVTVSVNSPQSLEGLFYGLKHHELLNRVHVVAVVTNQARKRDLSNLFQLRCSSEYKIH